MTKAEKIADAKKVLKGNGYFIDNLWSISDVKNNWSTQQGTEISDEDAQDVLNTALQNEATMQQIWMSIEYAARDTNLKNKHD